MIRYFFKLAFRNFKKYKLNTFISLLGLTVGLTSFILIASLIVHELSYNKFNDHYKDIYVARINYHMPNGIGQGENTPYPVVENLVSEYPEVKYGTRFSPINSQLENDNVSFFENNACYVDNAFFKIFTVRFLSGNRENPLQEPYTIVLTQKTAKKYFDDENPVGKTLLLGGKYNLKITAVIDNFPHNSDFNYDFFVSMKTLLATNPERDYSQRWGSYNFRTVFLLDQNINLKIFNKKIADLFNSKDDYDVKQELFLSPLAKFHLKKNENDDTQKMLLIFILVAVFILVIACINFINLSIANAANRVKEISICRIVGSKRSSLIIQQIGESVLLSFIAFDLAYLLAERLLPNFNAMIGMQIPFNIILNPIFILGMLLIIILLGVISGVFPAVKIGRIQPIRELSGNKTSLGRIGFGRKGLIVFQYMVSIVLIISTIVLSKQFEYIRNKDLGFESENLITAYIGTEGNELDPELEIFKNEILQYSGVQNIAFSYLLPFYGSNGTNIRKINAPEEEVISVDYNIIEESFFETFGVEILQSRGLSSGSISPGEDEYSDIWGLDYLSEGNKNEKKSSEDIVYCYINKTAEDALNFSNPIGERILFSNIVCEIVGVYKDFHMYSVQRKIRPQVLIIGGSAKEYDDYGWMTIQCNEHNLSEIKESATALLRERFPDNPYSFFYYGDTEFKNQVISKLESTKQLFGIFTLIAIIIACMGIIGLIALNVKNKTKEFGIRKTLGSSVFGIYKLIAKEYLLLAILGNILAWYPAWYFSNKILQDFAYRIDINVWVFVLGFIASILLTIITIAFHTLKAARTNPVEALRYE
ncbi:MAG: FtsX-like permease family protein [Bacteroidales bacterium]